MSIKEFNEIKNTFNRTAAFTNTVTMDGFNPPPKLVKLLGKEADELDDIIDYDFLCCGIKGFSIKFAKINEKLSYLRHIIKLADFIYAILYLHL